MRGLSLWSLPTRFLGLLKYVHTQRICLKITKQKVFYIIFYILMSQFKKNWTKNEENIFPFNIQPFQIYLRQFLSN